jgi:single-strand DNA-binding protein
MSGSLNRATLIGRLGKDPEIHKAADGRSIVNLSLATSESWRDKNSGERKERTEWHKVAIFQDGLAKVAEQYLKKGSKVYIEGQIQTRKWTDRGGADRYSTEIVLQGYSSTLIMLDDKRSGEPRPAGIEQGGSAVADLDDEIPFAPEWRL